MDELIPSLATLVEGFRGCFRHEVFGTFRHLMVGWIIAPGPHTLSEVWPATGRAAAHHWDTAYALFASAKWDWDDLGKILILLIVARLVPTGVIWVVVDDTLCHTRGAKVAFGGFFLDAATSTRAKKNFRFGVNWVVVGLTVRLPFRTDRVFALPVRWRAYRTKGTEGHAPRTQPAAELARQVAAWLPDRECWLVGDQAYRNRTVRADRPANLKVLGPRRGDAVLYAMPPARQPGQRGPNRKRGGRLPRPRQMIEDVAAYPAQELEFGFGDTTRKLRVQVVRNVLWYTGSKTEPMTVVLVRDAAGVWRDEVLLATTTEATAACAIAGYCRRWSVEVVFFESKQLLGLHDP